VLPETVFGMSDRGRVRRDIIVLDEKKEKEMKEMKKIEKGIDKQ